MANNVSNGNADCRDAQRRKRLAEEHTDQHEAGEREKSFHGDGLGFDGDLLEKALDAVLLLLRLDAAENHGRDQDGDEAADQRGAQMDAVIADFHETTVHKKDGQRDEGACEIPEKAGYPLLSVGIDRRSL